MTDRIEIPAGGDDIHVFGLDLTGPEAEAFVARPANNGGGWPLKVRLGASSLDPAHVEHFPVSDLAGVGLPGYLTEGLGADAAAVEAERESYFPPFEAVSFARPDYGAVEQLVACPFDEPSGVGQGLERVGVSLE